MIPNAPTDALDRLLSDFFKTQMKRPWPAAPAVPVRSEPSELVVVRNRTPVSAPDHSTRSRITLAASVAILFGSCWYLSNGSQPELRSNGPRPGSNDTGTVLPLSSAKESSILEKVKEIKATQPDPADAPMPEITDPFGK